MGERDADLMQKAGVEVDFNETHRAAFEDFLQPPPQRRSETYHFDIKLMKL